MMISRYTTVTEAARNILVFQQNYTSRPNNLVILEIFV